MVFNMKKKYIKPNIKLFNFSFEDVIRTSVCPSAVGCKSFSELQEEECTPNNPPEDPDRVQ